MQEKPRLVTTFLLSTITDDIYEKIKNLAPKKILSQCILNIQYTYEHVKNLEHKMNDLWHKALRKKEAEQVIAAGKCIDESQDDRSKDLITVEGAFAMYQDLLNRINAIENKAAPNNSNTSSESK